MANPDITRLMQRLAALRDEHTVPIRSSRKLLATGAPCPSSYLVAYRLKAMEVQAWRIAGDLYRAGATDAAFTAICGWAVTC